MPTSFALLLAAAQHHKIRNECHPLKHDGERHKEADRTPHGAEIPVIAQTVVAAREQVAGYTIQFRIDRGAAPVQAVGVAIRDAGGL